MLYTMQNKLFAATRKPGIGELALLEQLRRRLARRHAHGISLGLGDDCALLRVRPGEEMAITTDLSIDGRHFRLEWHPPESVGHRTLARGLSDLAAMGARPVAAFLSLGLPPGLTQSTSRSKTWLDRFWDGFLALADASRAPLAGGDLSESPIALADIVLVGAVPSSRGLLRSGARPGDRIYVTGALGGSAAGLAQLRGGTNTHAHLAAMRKKNSAALGLHLYPQPRITQGLWLQRKRLASAAIDLSDGLSTDLAHLCDESRVAAEIDAASLPIHPSAGLTQALHGGEEYELLFTAPAAATVPQSISGVRITPIGRITRRGSDEPRITLLTPEGRQPLTARGWQHFT